MKNRKDYPVYQLLEEKSKFFCPAKWTELYLYLNHGNSNSCHHPIPHAIPEELLDNPSVLHNTPYKLKMQQLMLDGHRPDECHMCWHVEDMDPDVVSDRIIKSEQWADTINSLTVDQNYIPKFIEVVFDNYCNLRCSYCDSGQSSSWAAKIHVEPLVLETDYRKLYSTIHIKPGTSKSNYYNAWIKWWGQIKNQVPCLKISGGEPLMSKNFWDFTQTLGQEKLKTLYINTNFSVESTLVQKLIQVSGLFECVHLGVSIDATGELAEYCRQGLDYQLLLDNIDLWCNNTNTDSKIYLQSTVNILSIWGLLDKFDLNIELRRRYPKNVTQLYSTLVRFPEFQSILLLPIELRKMLSTRISSWLSKNQHCLLEHEINYLHKTQRYLTESVNHLQNFNKDQLTLDFKKFLLYYDKSSKKSYKEIYPVEFVDWVNSI